MDYLFDFGFVKACGGFLVGFSVVVPGGGLFFSWGGAAVEYGRERERERERERIAKWCAKFNKVVFLRAKC